MVGVIANKFHKVLVYIYVQVAYAWKWEENAPLLVFCNVMNKIRKHTDTAEAFNQEYSRVLYPLRNVSTLSTGSGSSKDTHAGVGKTEEKTFYI